MARNFIPLVPSGTINADASVAQLEQDVLAMDSKVGELAEDIGDTEQEINQLKSQIKDNFAIETNVQVNLTENKFIDASNGNITNSNGFAVTDAIPVKKGQRVTLVGKGYKTWVGMICTCNSDNSSRTVKVACIDGDEHTYTYDVTEDGYITCSFYNNGHSISLTIDYYPVYNGFTMLAPQTAGTSDLPLYRDIDRKLVDSSGSVSNGDNFFISQPIPLYRGQTLNLTAQGYNYVVAMISLYDAEKNEYTPLLISNGGTLQTYSYTAPTSCTVRCCMAWYNAQYSATITTPGDMLGTIVAIEDKIAGDPLSDIEYPQLFANIICMGDSLTVGYIGSGSTVADHIYPFYFEKLTGADVTVQATGGASASAFWSAHSSDDYTAYDCAVIFLGTNDGLTNTVDTDCFEDYTQNANTNTGAYGKIIGHIKATAPNCKIFLVAGVNDYVRRATTMNPAVRALAEFYEVGLADIENCIMSDAGGSNTLQRQLYRPVDGIHYNTFGYMTMANMIYDAMNKFMADNRTMFKSNN